MERKRLTADDFWQRVDKRPDCWVWMGPLGSKKQLGYTCYEGIRENAQRIAWRILVDPDLDEKTQLRRNCKTPLCVHPDHHRAVGPRHLQEVLALRDAGWKPAAIARHYNVDRSTIAHTLRAAKAKKGTFRNDHD